MLADPYGYIGRRCVEFGTDLFEARLLLRRTICMTGPNAAALFYDRSRFQRTGAAPEPLRATLFGQGGVQGLDGDAHRHRKAMFMSLVTAAQVDALARRFEDELQTAARQWSRQPQVVLYDALHEPLTQAVCGWAGVPLETSEVSLRTTDLVALFDQAAAPGLGHFRARAARKRSEAWAVALVEALRAGRLSAPPGSPLEAVALHRDENEQWLPPRVAAVELLNVLRPTLAVSVFIVFVAHALHLHPECRLALQQREAGYADCFVQEVRRHYPFFPAVVARVREDFEWRGYPFPAGRRVMLDLYGTNHDSRAWRDPLAFEPARFRERTPTPFEFVPQGGAEPHKHHRCPGEGIAVELMKVAAVFFSTRLNYEVPLQDLLLDMKRLPALPRDRFVIASVRVAA
nr:cytochrome P450 [Caldimonas mangrovi]